MKRQIDFFNTLFSKLECRDQILQFLVDEKLLSITEKQNLLAEHASQHATKIAYLLDELARSEKLTLVSYEWKILPDEYYNLTLVTPSSKKEFTYTV